MESRESAVALFRERFGLDDRALARALNAALERPVDYADLFCEYSTFDQLGLEDGIVKGGSRRVEQGVGVRAQSGERQGYAHSDDVTVESAQLAAATARAISRSSGSSLPVAVGAVRAPQHDLYPVTRAPTEVSVEDRARLLGEIDAYARSLDPRVERVTAAVRAQQRHILVAGSDGTCVGDVQPLVHLNVRVIAQRGGRREVGAESMGGRYQLERLFAPETWRPLVERAVHIATVNLDAVACPAGTLTVVLGPGWPGILLHEAVGHGLEGDFNRRGTSAFAGRIGERVAADGVTVIDDGTLEARRGSLNMDDEGTPTQRTVLIEDGILRGYLQDRLNARLMGMAPTGNGRRESYAHLPMPRMTNTFMLAGEEEPEDVIRSVERGVYAVSFGGGQVDITSGKFVFSANEAYEIEGGRLGAPVKGATLIGNGPDVLTRVSRIGRDLQLDRGTGVCGKDGQGVPVGVGLPTLRIDGITVGGTRA